jgi:hypothetical protein
MLPVNDTCIRRGVGHPENIRLGAKGAGTLTVTASAVWLTHGDGTDDIVLSPGESVHFEPDAKTLASALGGPADVMICNDVGQSLPRAA